MLALKMQQDRMHFFDTEHELDDRMAWTESAQEVLLCNVAAVRCPFANGMTQLA